MTRGALRVLVLCPDAYGGRGGIALYSRDVLEALALEGRVGDILVLPRRIDGRVEPIPAKVRFDRGAAGPKRRTLIRLLRHAWRRGRFDLVLCLHRNLLPAAVWAARRQRAPLWLWLYGIEAWAPFPPRSRSLLPRVSKAVAISTVTRDRFLAWSGYPAGGVHCLPNAIHAERYGPGEAPAALVERYGLGQRRVLLTVGRMEAHEAYKGADRVIALLPRLLRSEPDLAYLVVGGGSDLPRLKQLAKEGGVSERVHFPGEIDESEKADHYRLADAYVMPSLGEGFGFVFLEAMACGLPIVASSRDGGRDVALGFECSEAVDPEDADALAAAILRALSRGKGKVPAGLERFSFPSFRQALARMVFGPGDPP